MAIIPQTTLFSWEDDIENLGDNARLKLVLDNLPDEDLVRKLEAERGRGRNDYPVRAMWNTLIAMVVFGHDTQAGIVRELARNVQLRHLCGFGYFGKTPGEDNLSRFAARLMEHGADVQAVFTALADRLYEMLPDFGETLAVDSKWTWSKASKKSGRDRPDGRSEADAEWGVKSYSGVDEGGREWSSTKKCFGFKTHLIVCAKYELPVAFAISSAAGSDVTCGTELLKSLAGERPHVLDRCKYLLGDKGYDSEALILWLQDAKRGIKPVIDKRSMWRSETEKEIEKCPGRYYDEQGNVYCYSPVSGGRHRMIPTGYDEARHAQRFKCPFSHYGMGCDESCSCSLPKTRRGLTKCSSTCSSIIV